MRLRQYVSFAALASLSALTGVVAVFATTGLLTASSSDNRGSDHQCNTDRCCFLCDVAGPSSDCMAIEWEESYGDFHEYCSGISYTNGGGGTYFNTRGECQNSGQCQAGNNSNCFDGIDNDGDQLFDNYDPDCMNNPYGGEFNFDSITDLEVKIDGPNHMGQGDTVTYTVTVENLRESTATNINVYGSFADLLVYIGNGAMPCYITHGSFDCRFDLGPMAKEVLRFEMVVDENRSVFGDCNDPVYAMDASAHTESIELYHDNNAANIITFLDCGECQDGFDNDQNGFTDFPDDAGCTSPMDKKEEWGQEKFVPECGDGTDNDHDGLVDGNDPGCWNNSIEGANTTECQDGFDNDGDGLIDGADPHCNGPQDNQEYEPVDNRSEIQNGNRQSGIPSVEPEQPRNNVPSPVFVPGPAQQQPPPVFVPEPQQPDMPISLQPIAPKEKERIDNLQQHFQEQQLRNAVNIQHDNPATANAPTALGCFTPEGIWTSDRSLCDQNQRRHIVKQTPDTLPEPLQAEAIHQQIKQRFVGDQQYNELMDALHALREKLLSARKYQFFSERDNNYVDYSIGWLNDQIIFYSTTEFSPEHVDYSVAIMNDIVSEMEKITQNARQEEIEIENIVSGIGGLFGKTYGAMQVLFRENIYVPDGIIGEFQRANALFIEIQNRCEVNQNTCGELSDVIAILEPMLGSLKNVVESSGNQAVENEIVRIFGG